MGNTALPPYMKYLAAGVLVSMYAAALTYAVYHYIADPSSPMPTEVTFILGAALTYALGVFNMHSGASMTEAMPPVTVTPGTTTTTSTAPVAVLPTTAATPPASSGSITSSQP